MFAPKSGLRSIATLITTIALASSLAATAAIPASATPIVMAPTSVDNSPATLGFLDRAFVNNEISLYGATEYGVTIEAMLQRRAGGYSLIKQLGAIKHVFTDRAVIGYNKVGYLYTPATSSAVATLRTGRAGMFLFASKALGVANGPLQNIFYAELKGSIAADGSVPLAKGNTVEYAWIALGLHAYRQDALANKVLSYAEAHQNSDGGFAGWSSASSTDGTGLALQAQAALRTYGGTKTVAARKASIGKAVAYLRHTVIDGNHWQSDNGDGTFSADANGTAYAAMGLKAVGLDISKQALWFRGQLAADGGIKSAWSGSTGDTFATAQGYAPMIGKTYLSLLPTK